YKEFLDQGPGKKKRLRYYVKGPGGERVDKLPALSPRGRLAQDVLAGIAAALGGDHTQDLPRLLRLPDTLNRKDQRNGKPPVPCALAECHPERRYPFADFERFARAAAAAQETPAPSDEQLAAVRLPSGTKLTAGRLNKFNEYVNACASASL